MTELRRLLSIAAAIALSTACTDPGVIAFQDGGQVKWSPVENIPPGNATDVQLVTSVSGWDLEHLSLSPNGGLLALGLRKGTNPSQGILDARVLVFNIFTDIKLAEWDEGDLKRLIESNAGLTYPSQLVDFNPRKLSWMSSTELLLNVQPIIAGTSPPVESLPQDVAIVIRPENSDVTDGPHFYPRTGVSPLTAPNHPSKTAFTVRNTAGTIFVNNSPMTGLPGGVGMFDFVYLGN